MYLQHALATSLLAVLATTPAAYAGPAASEFLTEPGLILAGHASVRTGATGQAIGATESAPRAAGATNAAGAVSHGSDANASDAGAPPATPLADLQVTGFGKPAAAETLGAIRGGDGGIASDTRLDGTVSGNSASHVVTGNNVIQSGSFANTTGVPIVIQNSGANVLIQNATVINLQVK